MSIHLTSAREHGAIRPLFEEKPGGATDTNLPEDAAGTGETGVLTAMETAM
jgi:hypothetical protein